MKLILSFFFISLACLEILVGCNDFMFVQALMLLFSGLFFLLLAIIDYTYNQQGGNHDEA